MGVRTGKELSLKEEGYTQEDVRNVELKSVDEEYVDEVVEKNEASNFEDSIEPKKETGEATEDDALESRLREEMERLAKEKESEKKSEKLNETVLEDPPVKDAPVENENTERNLTGKYTIQLFSHQSKETAEEFADGFILKGYDVIINEVDIPGKGKWYRVGIGVFDTVNQAQDYLDKEKSLFQKNNYLIQKI